MQLILIGWGSCDFGCLISDDDKLHGYFGSNVRE